MSPHVNEKRKQNNDKVHLRHGIALSDVSDLELHMHHL